MTAEALMAETWPRYSLGKIRHTQRLQQGFANENYRVTSEKGIFLFRIYRQQPVEHVTKEHRMLTVLQAHHFPSAFPVPDKNGNTLQVFGTLPVAVFPFIAGTIPQLNEQTTAEIARTLARLHTIPPGTVPFKENVLAAKEVEKLTTRFPHRHPFLQSVINNFLRQWKETKPFLQEKLPTGLIHGDLFPDNTLFSDNQLLAVIDFEEYCIDSLLFDVAMTMNGFCFMDNQPQLRLLKHFLKTYESLRPFTVTEKKLLFPYLRYTALAMASWHLRYHLLQRPDTKQEKRVWELLERADQIEKYADYL